MQRADVGRGVRQPQQDLIGTGRRTEHDPADVDDLIVDPIDLAQLHAHDPVDALAHHQLDAVVAQLIGRRAGAADEPVQQPDAVDLSRAVRLDQVEQALDSEIVVVLQARDQVGGIDVGSYGREVADERIRRADADGRAGVGGVDDQLAAGFLEGAAHAVGMRLTVGEVRRGGRRQPVGEGILEDDAAVLDDAQVVHHEGDRTRLPHRSRRRPSRTPARRCRDRTPPWFPSRRATRSP